MILFRYLTLVKAAW